MRKQFTNKLRAHFQEHILLDRDRLGISQEEMASRLAMCPRSYSNLEHGKSCCGGVTLLAYMLFICKDTDSFLEEIRHAIEDEICAGS